MSTVQGLFRTCSQSGTDRYLKVGHLEPRSSLLGAFGACKASTYEPTSPFTSQQPLRKNSTQYFVFEPDGEVSASFVILPGKLAEVLRGVSIISSFAAPSLTLESLTLSFQSSLIRSFAASAMQFASRCRRKLPVFMVKSSYELAYTHDPS